MKLYIVSGDKQQDCRIYDYVFYTFANNAKEACAIARETWTSQNKRHLFHVHAVKSRVQDIADCTVHNWKGCAISGLELLNRFYCLDFHTWRVNGRSVYGL